MQRVIYDDGELCVRISDYAPGAWLPLHRDDQSRITLILRGDFLEEGRRGSQLVRPGDVLLKSRMAMHEDRFGDVGGRLLSVLFRANSVDGLLGDALDGVLTVRRDADALRHGASMLDAVLAQNGSALKSVATELVSSLNCGPERSRPPPWLKALKSDLEVAGLTVVNVTARARDAGVHPVHASRLFRSCFGVSITDHAQLHGVRRAVRALASGDALSGVAAAAGFYDQSHMTRVFRRLTGRPPGSYRALMLAAAG